MKNTLVLIVVALLSITLHAQVTQEQQAIADEGRKLYELEKAAWNGTDMFTSRYPNERKDMGGYFSYKDSAIVKFIVFSASGSPKVIATITFDSSFKIGKANVDRTKRAFTTYENDIYTIRKKALKELNSNSLYSIYKSTSLNLIPLVSGNDRKVYILTGPKEHGVVIFGNDYLMTFDEKNKLVAQKKLHANIIPLEYDGKKTGVTTSHSHTAETGDLITATDICTLLLYQEVSKWEGHVVLGPESLSTWNCKSGTLSVTPRKKN